MQELYEILSEKCEANELYGEEYDAINVALFEKYAVSVIVTGADGESLVKSNVDPKLLTEQLNYTLLSNDNTSESIEATT